MFLKRTLILLFVFFLFLHGCGGGRYVNPNEVDEVGSSWQVTDQHRIADSMVQSLMGFPFPSNSVVRVDRIRNKTSEHIDTKDITNLIVSKLQKKLAYRHLEFVVDYSELDGSDRAAAIEINRRISDKDRQRFLNNQVAPRYRIYGSLTGVRQISSSKKDVSYQFALKVEDFETGKMWSDVGEVRKIVDKPLLGY